MKLKQAAQLAIIGVILQLMPFIIDTLILKGILKYSNWQSEYLNIISIIGIALLLPFFITVFKSQR